ncbi:murein biosynthesis integral membrane protein MurJ [Halovulum sp. GXIMD14793]
MSRRIRLLPAFLTVGVWTLVSRLLGFARDVLFAAFLGSSAAGEAFFAAFTLPNMFRRLFAEGAFNMAFVPMFSRRLERGEDAEGFAQEAFAGLATVLIGLTLLAQLTMPWLVLMLASGFAGDERFDLATAFGRITFPYIIFISLAALCSGVLNATGRFAAAAAAPVLLNIILVSVMALGHFIGADIVRLIVWTVPFAGMAQLAMVWVAARQAGIRLTPRWPSLSPDMKRLAIIAAPAALAGGVVQINLIVGRQVASQFEHAYAWLFYADRLYQLPLGLVGVAIGVVLLPDLSRRLGAGDREGGISALNRATEFAMVLTLPAAIALMVVPLPLVSVLFQRGDFNAADTAATALAVAVYGAGLPAFVLQKVLSPVFFAREDTRTPFRYAVVSMLVNAAVAIGLAPVLGFWAAALGTTLAGWANAALLWRGATRIDGALQIDTRLRRALPRQVAAALIMGAAAFGLSWLMSDWLAAPTLRYLALALLVAASAAIYGICVVALGGMRLADLKSALRRSAQG